MSSRTRDTPEPRSSNQASRDRDVDLPVDELGRLMAAAGLCSIVKSWPHSPNAYDLYLELAYDERGRPEQAKIEVGPYCRGSELAGDEPTLVGKVDPCDPPDLELQVIVWTWDAQDRLVALEHTAMLERGAAEDKRRCLGSDPLVIERSEWVYDEAGRLTKWTNVSADCDGRKTIEETMRHGRSAGVVTRVIDGERTESRYRLDHSGAVIEEGPRRHKYDSLGRLIETAHSDGWMRQWSYDASFVGSDVPWTREFSDDGRVIRLRKGGSASEDGIEIVLDARRRPIEVKNDDWHFELTYGGCPHAEHARPQWSLSDFVSWPFPEPAPVSWGDAAREAWTRSVPLYPFAYVP